MAHLVEHVIGACRVYLWAGGVPIPDPVDALAAPAAAWAQARDAVQAALDDPDVAAAEHDFRLGVMPTGRAIDLFLSTDVFVHGWDLATATGQDATLPADEVTAMLARLADAAPAMRATGLFGDAIEVPADAPDQTRLLGLFGRRA